MKLRLSIPKFSLYFSTILFVAYLITSAMVYYGNGNSMGTIQLGLSLVTIGIYFRHKKIINTVPMLLLTIFVLLLLASRVTYISRLYLIIKKACRKNDRLKLIFLFRHIHIASLLTTVSILSDATTML